MTPGPADEAPNGPSDADLTQRLNQAQLVVSGTVSSTSRLATQRPGFLSQHDPDWWQATVEIESVEKGEVTAKTVPVLFANSADVAWYQSPKLKKGDHGVWLLQSKDQFGKPLPGLGVVSAADSQPITQLPHLRTLLQTAAKK